MNCVVFEFKQRVTLFKFAEPVSKILLHLIQLKINIVSFSLTSKEGMALLKNTLNITVINHRTIQIKAHK